jgi:hypothetical protein
VAADGEVEGVKESKVEKAYIEGIIWASITKSCLPTCSLDFFSILLVFYILS